MYEAYRAVEIPDLAEPLGTGWLPPLPDLRDYTPAKPEIAAMSKTLGVADGGKKLKAAPSTIDLRQWCSPIQNQKNLGSSTANAAVGVYEYYQRRAFGKHIDGSRLFVYKTTRNLMQVTGDTGAWLRTTMGALVLYGVPPETCWPYADATSAYDKEPSSLAYSLGDNYQAMQYFSHDPLGANVPTATVLTSVKNYLAAGIPSMFGFWGFPSFNSSDIKGGIPYPCPGEEAQWGHAIVAVGYDDAKKIKNTICNKTTTGALLIRNSWGKQWGDQGYGWMPYDYVLDGLALDFWSLLSHDWVETKVFEFGKQ